MNTDLVLLLTRDLQLEQESAVAAATTNVRLIAVRTVGEGLGIAQRPIDLDLVVIDFDNDTRGAALLSALSTFRTDLPIVTAASTNRDHSTAPACTDGAPCCLTKPINAAELETVIRAHTWSEPQVKAA